MTDALLLATHLRSLPDADLEALLVRRGIDDSPRLVDFFDVAERLLVAEQIDAALRDLTRPSFLALSAAAEIGTEHSLDELASRIESMGSGEQAVTDAVEHLAVASARGLIVVERDRVQPLDAVEEALARLRANGLPTSRELAQRPPARLSPVRERASSHTPEAAGERAFAGTAATAELLSALLRVPARELGRGGLALPDRKRLAAATALSFDDVERTVAIAARAKLVTLRDRTWMATPAALDWLDASTVERWSVLTAAWISRVDDSVRHMLARHPQAPWSETLLAYASWWHPACGDALEPRIGPLIESCRLLGIVVDDELSEAGRLLLSGEPDAAAEHIRATLPAEVAKVYLQDDLSVVSPGPLLPRRDARLRLMADIESRSQASTYRFSRSSIDRALSAGEDATSILAFLDDLSLTGVPQPVRYLVADVAARHGLLRVREVIDAERPNVRSSIRSADEQLLETLSVDQNLTTLGLRRSSPHELVSRFPPDVVFGSLQDARHAVSMEDADGRLVNATHARVAEPTPERHPDLSAFVVRLREGSAGTPDAPDEAWLTRQLDLAMRQRASVIVTVAMPDGSSVELRLEPTGIAGGRVRGRDNAADVERTLPLASITAVRPADR